MTDWYKTSQSWTKGDGDCMQVAANLMMDLHYNFNQLKSEIAGDPFLVHGLVYGRGGASGHRFPHAWVEAGGIVYDFSSGQKIKIPVEIYYAIGNIEPNDPKAYRKYSFEEMRKKLLSTKHYGPWDLDESLQEKPKNYKKK